MSTRAELLDGTQLPRQGLGTHSTIWAGVVIFVIIEGTVMLSLITSYFYLRVTSGVGWPPLASPMPDLVLSSTGLGLLLLSIAPMAWSARNLAVANMNRFRFGILAALLLAMGYLVLGTMDLRARDYTWKSHVYGSITWTVNGYQLFHVLLAFIVAFALLVFGWNGRYAAEARAPAQAVALYWIFVALAGVPAFVSVTLSPYFF